MRHLFAVGMCMTLLSSVTVAQDVFEQYQAAHDTFVGTYSVGDYFGRHHQRLLAGLEGDWVDVTFTLEADRDDVAERCETAYYRWTPVDDTTLYLDLVSDHPMRTVLTGMGGASFMAYTERSSAASRFGYDQGDTDRLLVVMPLLNGPSMMFRPSADIVVLYIGSRASPRVLGRCDALPE